MRGLYATLILPVYKLVLKDSFNVPKFLNLLNSALPVNAK